MTAYYNENDPAAAEWLRGLVSAGHIAPGDVDDRSIKEVTPGDLKGYTQCHFFAGIGVWSYALRRAGWPDDRPVWTGSCPCQPFSSAGKRKGFGDDRHLWPVWFDLIRERGPVVVLGEQVGGSGGRAWIDLVHDDMEANGYAVGALDTPACSVGAPHIRQRLYWVACATGAGPQRSDVTRERACAQRTAAERDGDAGSLGGHWRGADWVYCREEKPSAGPTWRPTETGTFPLAHGATGRVGRLRAYGNAIVAPQAEAFVRVVMEGLR